MKIYKYKGHRIRASDKHLVYHYCIGTLLYDKQIEVLQQKMLELIEESAGKQTADEDFDKEYRVIANQMKALKKQGQMIGFFSQGIKHTVNLVVVM